MIYSSVSSSFDIDSTSSSITEGFSNVSGITSEVTLEIDPIDTTTEVEIADQGGTTEAMKTANTVLFILLIPLVRLSNQMCSHRIAY